MKHETGITIGLGDALPTLLTTSSNLHKAVASPTPGMAMSHLSAASRSARSCATILPKVRTSMLAIEANVSRGSAWITFPPGYDLPYALRLMEEHHLVSSTSVAGATDDDWTQGDGFVLVRLVKLFEAVNTPAAALLLEANETYNGLRDSEDKWGSRPLLDPLILLSLQARTALQELFNFWSVAALLCDDIRHVVSGQPRLLERT